MFFYWILIAAEAVLMRIFRSPEVLAYSEEFYIAMIGINLVVLMGVLYTHYCKERTFSLMLLGGLMFRVVLMFWSEYYSHIFQLPNSGADELTFYYNAMSNLVKGTQFEGYPAVFAWQAGWFGLSKIYGKFINVLFSVTAILTVRAAMKKLELSESARNWGIGMMCFLPNYAIMSSLLLRESLLTMLVSFTLYGVAVWWKSGRFRWIVAAVAASVAAAWLHSGMIVLVFCILVLALTAEPTVHGYRYRLFTAKNMAIFTAVMLSGFMVIVNADIGLSGYFRGADSIEDIVSISDNYEDGGSRYNANIVDNSSLVGFLINTPVRMLYFLLSPMPWSARGVNDLIAILFSSLVYGAILLMAVRMARYPERPGILPAMLMFALAVLVIFGWGTSNAGTALRHRDKMVAVYAIMLALICETRIRMRRTYDV